MAHTGRMVNLSDPKPELDVAALAELRDRLREKLSREVPEFRQLMALEAVLEPHEKPRLPGIASTEPRPPKSTIEGLALAAVRKAGVPLHIDVVLEAIDRVKKFPDKHRARINVVSALSKGKALASVKWRGAYAWWPTGEKLPDDGKGASL